MSASSTKKHMGSTIIGNATLETNAGLAMLQDKEIGRDGFTRVGIGGRT